MGIHVDGAARVNKRTLHTAHTRLSLVQEVDFMESADEMGDNNLKRIQLFSIFILLCIVYQAIANPCCRKSKLSSQPSL